MTLKQFLRKHFSEVYEMIYAEAGQIFKQYNLCDIREDGHCRTTRAGRYPKHVRCCEGCQYHDLKRGCTVKALGCKLWYCVEVAEIVPDEARERLDNLEKVAGGLATGYREKKLDSLNCMMKIATDDRRENS